MLAHPARSLAPRRRRPWLVLLPLLLATACSTTDKDSGEPEGRDSTYEIQLHARTFTPAPGIDPATRTALAAGGRDPIHVLLQLERRPTLDEHRRLDAEGIDLQGSLGGMAYTAALPPGLDPTRGTLAELLRWMGPFLPEDKLVPSLAQGAAPDWARDPASGMTTVLVSFFDDVGEERGRADLASLGVSGTYMGGRAYPGPWAIRTDASTIEALTRLETVKLIEPGPLPDMPLGLGMALNNGGRAATRTDQAQNATFAALPPTYALGGSGYRIGILDTGIDEDHTDFFDVPAPGGTATTRVSRPRSSDGGHGTHVASIAAGSGARSEPEGFHPFQLRGHAPEAELGDYSMSAIKSAASAETVVTDDGMDLTNNSYVQNIASYGSFARLLDDLCRGDAADDDPIRAVPHVFAAGNNGTGAQYGSEIGYYSVFTSAKNTLSVGATRDDGRVPWYTSLGPTFDGRIKPDVAAPGTSILAAESGTQGYVSQTGTSMAAPAVSGITALLMESYTAKFAINPPPIRPSIYKAILVQTAVDQVKTASYSSGEFNNPDTGANLLFGPGPDFVTGYGMVDAEAATELIADSSRWAQRQIVGADDPDEVQIQTWCVWVPDSSNELRVTLAWDDESADTSAAVTANKLVNDLDLELVDPNGTVWLPWTLDPLPRAGTPGDGTADPITTTPDAYRAIDTRNNVEMVTVPSPAAGFWTLRVRGSDLPLGTTQTFSVASSHDLKAFCLYIAEVPICDLLPWVCEPRIPRLPEIIEGELIPADEVIPIDEICKYVLNCPGCEGPGWAYCPGWEMTMEGLPSDAIVYLFDDGGNVVQRIDRGEGKRVLRMDRPAAGRAYFVAFSDANARPYGKEMRVRVDMRGLD